MAAKPAAPEPLDVIRRFVNTYDLEDHTDRVGTPEELAEWLTEEGLLDEGEKVTPREVGHAAEVRGAIRELLLAHIGRPLDPQAPRTLDAAARRSGLGVRFHADGAAAVEPDTKGVDRAIGRLLAIIAAAMADGTWERLKACAADDCHWAFYDHTRNRSGRWCSMAVCGNRAKVERFRERAREGA
jgi:predicted RNA-binding Zn ribbon-like protein